MDSNNQSLPPGYSASDVVPVGGDQSSQSSSLPPGYSASDIVPVDSSSPSTDPSQPQSFTTPGGSSYNVGQSVQHSDGTHGEITGQHPDTGNAVVKWHQGADQFKQGMLVRVDGHSGVVTGKTNNGKVLVDWGNKGITSVSPGDIEAPGGLGSFVAGAAGSLVKTAQGAAKMFGVNSDALNEDQNQTQQSTAVNPASGKAGELAGDLVQWLGVNGLVKEGTGVATAIPVAERYAQAAKILKVLDEHPVLAKILHSGINGAATGGILAGAQSGGNLTSTAEGAAGGAFGEGLGESIPELYQGAKNIVGGLKDSAVDLAGKGVDLAKGAIDKGTTALGNQVEKIVPGTFPEAIPQSAVDTANSTADSVEAEAAKAGGPEALAQHPASQEAASLRSAADQQLQASKTNVAPESWRTAETPLSPEEARQTAQEKVIEPFHDKIREAISNVAKEAGVNFEPGKSIQDYAHSAADAILDKSSKLYSQVDEAIQEATGKPGKFQAHDEEIRKIQEKLSDAIGDKEAQAKFTTALNEAQAKRNATWSIIKENKLDDVAQKASDYHKLGSALQDLGDKIRTSTNGKVGSVLDPERVNPNTFQTALRNLRNNSKFGDSRLSQALGKGSDDILQATSDAKVGLRQLKEAAAKRMSNATEAQKLAQESLDARQAQATQAYKDLSAKADAAEAQAKLAQGAKQFELQQAAKVARDKATEAAKNYSDVLQHRAAFKKKAALGALGSLGVGAGYDVGHHIANIFTGD